MSFGPKADHPAATPDQAWIDAAATVGTWASQQAFERGCEVGQQEADWEIAGALLDQNEAYRAPGEADQEMAAYGELGREHFGDPRPGDYPGRQAEHENENEAEAG